MNAATGQPLEAQAGRPLPLSFDGVALPVAGVVEDREQPGGTGAHCSGGGSCLWNRVGLLVLRARGWHGGAVLLRQCSRCRGSRAAAGPAGGARPPLSLAIADANALKVGLEGFEPEGDGDSSCPETSTSGAVVGPQFIEPMEVGGHLCLHGWSRHRGGACLQAALAFFCAFEGGIPFRRDVWKFTADLTVRDATACHSTLVKRERKLAQAEVQVTSTELHAMHQECDCAHGMLIGPKRGRGHERGLWRC